MVDMEKLQTGCIVYMFTVYLEVSCVSVTWHQMPAGWGWAVQCYTEMLHSVPPGAESLLRYS